MTGNHVLKFNNISVGPLGKAVIDLGELIEGHTSPQTYGYGGGVNANGDLIAAVGFDPIVTVLDPAGTFLNV